MPINTEHYTVVRAHAHVLPFDLHTDAHTLARNQSASFTAACVRLSTLIIRLCRRRAAADARLCVCVYARVLRAECSVRSNALIAHSPSIPLLCAKTMRFPSLHACTTFVVPASPKVHGSVEWLWRRRSIEGGGIEHERDSVCMCTIHPM